MRPAPIATDQLSGGPTALAARTRRAAFDGNTHGFQSSTDHSRSGWHQGHSSRRGHNRRPPVARQTRRLHATPLGRLSRATPGRPSARRRKNRHATTGGGGLAMCDARERWKNGVGPGSLVAGFVAASLGGGHAPRATRGTGGSSRPAGARRARGTGAGTNQLAVAARRRRYEPRGQSQSSVRHIASRVCGVNGLCEPPPPRQQASARARRGLRDRAGGRAGICGHRGPPRGRLVLTPGVAASIAAPTPTLHRDDPRCFLNASASRRMLAICDRAHARACSHRARPGSRHQWDPWPAVRDRPGTPRASSTANGRMSGSRRCFSYRATFFYATAFAPRAEGGAWD